jgi:hypothetical protein
VRAFFPPAVTRRIVAQQAVFTVHPRPRERMDSGQDVLCLRVRAGETKRQLELELRRCGINPESLFPGLDGLSVDVNRGFTMSLMEAQLRSP